MVGNVPSTGLFLLLIIRKSYSESHGVPCWPLGSVPQPASPAGLSYTTYPEREKEFVEDADVIVGIVVDTSGKFALARDNGPKNPVVGRPFLPCQHFTELNVMEPKYPVGMRLKHPAVANICCKFETSLPLMPCESDRSNEANVKDGMALSTRIKTKREACLILLLAIWFHYTP